jgi:GNAT superfamily N-acetyltransferase
MRTAAVDASPQAPPPGYPREYERRLLLRDGRSVVIRPIVPDDQDALAEAFRTADAETLHRRFLGSPPPPTPELLAHLCTVDYRRRFALVAADAATEHGVAIARYEGTEPGVAEIAVAVHASWRRLGLATALIELLAEAALERGIHSFSASYLAGNRPVAVMVGLAGGAGSGLIRQGVAEAAVALDQEQVDAAIHELDDAERAGTAFEPHPPPVATRPR